LRQVCAIAVFTGLRPGELYALLWSDVDLKARTISVSKAIDEATGEAKPPKTAAGQRLVPIHAILLPLLEALRGASNTRVLPSHDEARMAGRFRAYLRQAGVTRPRLEADTETEEPIDARSLRDTNATWLALIGTSDKIIQRRLGHASPATTDKYVKAAETFDALRVGTPFPRIPRALLGRVYPRVSPNELTNAEKMPAIPAPRSLPLGERVS
jgi:integrase